MRARIAVAAIVLVGLVLAWWIRWGCDDAYISYVYARDLVYGDGITWFGTHIEGYTNFLWVLWSAAGIAVGLDPLAWAWVGSLAALAIVLVTTYRIARLRTGCLAVALCAPALLVVNYTFLAFGTSGLETMLQCALLTAAYYEVERLQRNEPTSPRRLALLSVVAALALWTRLDSAVVLAVLGAVALRHLVRTKASRTAYIAAIVPAALLVGGWLAWKLAYYGDILPNTFHAKVEVTSLTLKAAAKFVGTFFHAYGLWPLLIAIALIAAARRKLNARLPFAVVGLWLAYIIFVGGDFMEFRFFVPVLPILFVGIAEELCGERWRPRWLMRPVRTAMLTALLVVFSVRHAKSFTGSEDGFFDSVGQLGSFYGKVHDNDWSTLGTPIGDALAETSASLACNGAGAIPYFADLPTVDQLGLNDAWVARHGARPKAGTYTRPGHQRFATHAYLAERKVTFVIGSPVLIHIGALTQLGLSQGVLYWIERLLGPTGIEGDSIIVVAVPVTDEMALLMWYLTPDPEIDRRIQAAGWEVRVIHRHN
jgi:hypothetical protein